jgi:hypothetical protein
VDRKGYAMTITTEKRQNVEKLIKELYKLHEGKDPLEFGMSYFFAGKTLPVINLVYRPVNLWEIFHSESGEIPHGVCGSQACVVGHAAMFFEPLVSENWYEFSKRLFVTELIEWEWCFSEDWADYDNTLLGAIKRLAYYLEHGVPEEFNRTDPFNPYRDYISLYENMDISKYLN